MRWQTAYVGVVVAALAVGLGLTAYGFGLVEYPGEDVHDRAVVTVVDGNGTTVATLEVRVADTRSERIRGLSESTPIPNGTGMLFVHGGDGTRTYVMDGMSFPLDIVFVGADGRINSIHHAPVPPPDRSYTGEGKYVLEVPRGWADANGVDPGDRIRIDYRD